MKTKNLLAIASVLAFVPTTHGSESGHTIPTSNRYGSSGVRTDRKTRTNRFLKARTRNRISRMSRRANR